MSRDKFHLSRSDFYATATETFKTLQEDTDFIDVTLVCDGDNQVSAHKVILSANSTFFRKVLTSNHHQHPLIYIAGIKLSDLRSLLRFMYTGEVSIEEKDLQSFLHASETLKIEGLSSYNKVFQSVSQSSELAKKREHHEFVLMEEDNVATFEEAVYENYCQSNDLQDQVAYNLSDTKEYCGQCNFRASTKHFLNTHIQSIHDQPAYSGEVLDKKANNENYQITPKKFSENKLSINSIRNSENNMNTVSVQFKLGNSWREFKVLKLSNIDIQQIRGIRAEDDIVFLISDVCGPGLESFSRGHFDCFSWRQSSKGAGRKKNILSTNCKEYSAKGCPATKRKWLCLGKCEYENRFCCEYFKGTDIFVCLYAFKHCHEPPPKELVKVESMETGSDQVQ